MNKKLLFALVFVLVGSLLIISSIALAKCDLARLEIINKTSQPVSISLTYDVLGKPALFYYLTVPPNSTKLFTVERHVYARTTWSCDKVDSGTVDILTQLRLTFTKCTCGNDAPNSGEPGLEKVHIPDAPSGEMWRYK
jgi:hypothetical protein